MNRIVVLFFVVLTFATFYSCSNSESYTVGYLNAASFRDRFVAEGDYMAERLRELGHETIVRTAEDDDAVQLAQGYNYWLRVLMLWLLPVLMAIPLPPW